MRDCQPWSAEDDALLNSLAGDGLSASQIATRMGRSRSSVIGRSYRKGSGVTGRSTASNGRAWTSREKVLIVNPDAPLNVIAERIGRTPQAVSTKRNRIGAPKSKPKPKPVRSVQLPVGYIAEGLRHSHRSRLRPHPKGQKRSWTSGPATADGHSATHATYRRSATAGRIPGTSIARIAMHTPWWRRRDERTSPAVLA
jgi:hypothetical protein